tara:strand:- start:1560 stop:1787 length:228 start_codon:yes stop_codon:yes gene_type:complete
MSQETLTAEEIQAHYDAAMDSVNLLNSDKPEQLSDDEWTACVSRNVEHLEIMVAKTYWTDAQDTSVLQDAIDANS